MVLVDEPVEDPLSPESFGGEVSQRYLGGRWATVQGAVRPVLVVNARCIR